MQINDFELFEFFSDVFSETSNPNLNRRTQTDGFCEPSETLKVECVSLKTVLNDDVDMLTALRSRYVNDDNLHMAEATTKILEFLTASDSNFDAQEERPKRLLDYVYPTV